MKKIILTMALLVSVPSVATVTDQDGSTISGTSGVINKYQKAMANENLREFLVTGSMTPFMAEVMDSVRGEIASKIGEEATAELTDREIAVGLLLAK